MKIEYPGVGQLLLGPAKSKDDSACVYYYHIILQAQVNWAPNLTSLPPDKDGRGGECPQHAVDFSEAAHHLQASFHEHPQ